MLQDNEEQDSEENDTENEWISYISDFDMEIVEYLILISEKYSISDFDIRCKKVTFLISILKISCLIVNQKYSSTVIQRYIEKIYYFDSLNLLGNWNLFLMSFKDMEIIDCIGCFFI